MSCNHPSSSITIRNMQPGDLPGLTALVDALGMVPVNSLKALRTGTLDDPTSPAELRLLACDKDRLVGFCLGCVRGPQGVIKLFGVDAAFRRQGIASALFATLEQRLAERGASSYVVTGVSPNWFFPGVELVYTAAIAFLMQRGYETDRNARVDMRVDLAKAHLDTLAEEASLAAEGIVIRRATPEDLPATDALIAAHFSENWRVEAGDALQFQPMPLHIALDSARVVSFAAYDVSGPSRFGPTGTDPAYRRRGIGGILLKRCLRDIRELGGQQSEICWVGPIGYYARAVGAQIHRAYWGFRKER